MRVNKETTNLDKTNLYCTLPIQYLLRQWDILSILLRRLLINALAKQHSSSMICNTISTACFNYTTVQEMLPHFKNLQFSLNLPVFTLLILLNKMYLKSKFPFKPNIYTSICSCCCTQACSPSSKTYVHGFSDVSQEEFSQQTLSDTHDTCRAFVLYEISCALQELNAV